MPYRRTSKYFKILQNEFIYEYYTEEEAVSFLTAMFTLHIIILDLPNQILDCDYTITGIDPDIVQCAKRNAIKSVKILSTKV